LLHQLADQIFDVIDASADMLVVLLASLHKLLTDALNTATVA
jgi:hypothetical protein